MKARFAALGLALALQACGSPGPSGVRAWSAIDLDRPGVLERLERQNPEHYAKIRRLVDEAPRRAPKAVPDWMRDELGARNIDALLFASNQLRVTFALDGRDYTKLIPYR